MTHVPGDVSQSRGKLKSSVTIASKAVGPGGRWRAEAEGAGG